MEKFLTKLISGLNRLALWLRYRVTVKGLENLNPSTLSKPSGILFLPNHPTIFIDSILVSYEILKKYKVRPMVVESMYYHPFFNYFFTVMKALPMPEFISSSNSLKKKRVNQMNASVIDGLKKGDNFLIYPAGKIKSTEFELIGGSTVPYILHNIPEVNVVLIRTTGLWGSIFSKAISGINSPNVTATGLQGVKIALKNLLFFTPRRPVTIEFVPAPADFPYQGSRLEINRYLENWYNQTSPQHKESSDQLTLVSHSLWKEEFAVPYKKTDVKEEMDVSKIPEKIQESIKRKLSEITEIPSNLIQPSQSLLVDLGLDSLDVAEMVSFLDDEYDIGGIHVSDVLTVYDLMGLASKQITPIDHKDEVSLDASKWNHPIQPKKRVYPAEGQTIPEIFFNICALMKNENALVDQSSGILTYSQAKMRVILLADLISKLPGKNIGILLPASVTAYLLVIACQLADKVPVMINWTVGPRHLESVKALSNLDIVLTSCAFIDRLENVQFSGLEDNILFLEDFKRDIKISHKIKALFRSKLSTSALLKLFKMDKIDPNSTAVLLFTSGTEGMPKGVPLSHNNIVRNIRSSAKTIPFFSDDIFIGMLPCFHAFGFTITGLLPLLIGCKVVYSPDPTDSVSLAKAIQKWKVTIVGGAPTFLKGIFKASSPGELDPLRMIVSGAEKTPTELFQMVKTLPHGEIYEGYGITECSPVITINMSGDHDKGVGIALADVELAIVDLNTHQLLPKNKQGLILTKGPNIFDGYLNKDVASPFITIANQRWYNTGDLGWLDDENNLVLSGRLKRFVKIGGEMVSLSSIETALMETLTNQTTQLSVDKGPLLAVCAKELAGEKTRLSLFTSQNYSQEEANRALREAGFSNLIKISKVHTLNAIPIMGTGKINYRELESQLES